MLLLASRVRSHWALVPESGGDPATTEEVYTGRVTPQLPRWQGWARAAGKKLDLTQRDRGVAAARSLTKYRPEIPVELWAKTVAISEKKDQQKVINTIRLLFEFFREEIENSLKRHFT
jgi:hypothetical protein